MISPIQPVNCVLSKPDTTIRPKQPEIARHEEDHLCCVPHLRKSLMPCLVPHI